MKNNNYSGFYKLTVDQRLQEVVEFADLNQKDVDQLSDANSLDLHLADHMIENVIGRFSLPLSVGMNFIVNGKEVLVPMVTEEASVVAAASNAAKMTRKTGGFHSSYTGSIMIAQIQLIDLPDPHFARSILFEKVDEIKRICNEQDPFLAENGGGFKDLEVRIINTPKEQMLVVHLKVDTLDAMGANAVNTMAEAVSPYIEKMTKGTLNLRILSNLAVHRLARSRVEIDKSTIGGEKVIDKILSVFTLAKYDPYRAATNNKGIMNGIVPVVMATGNDTRAIESGAHAYASLNGQYTTLTQWERNSKGNLVGSIELPMAVGLVGGATKTHPVAKTSIKILDVKTSGELAEIIAAVGLAQNLAAIRAIATEGIQKGHMSLHARNIAIVAGADGEKIDVVIQKMIEENKINVENAKRIIESLNK